MCRKREITRKRVCNLNTLEATEFMAVAGTVCSHQGKRDARQAVSRCEMCRSATRYVPFRPMKRPVFRNAGLFSGEKNG